MATKWIIAFLVLVCFAGIAILVLMVPATASRSEIGEMPAEMRRETADPLYADYQRGNTIGICTVPINDTWSLAVNVVGSIRGGNAGSSRAMHITCSSTAQESIALTSTMKLLRS